MSGCTVILGDDLPVLHQLSQSTGVATGVDSAFTPPRAVFARALVIGMDLSGATSARDAKRALKDELRQALTDTRRYPELVHVFITYLAPAHVSGDRLSSAAAGIASRLHAALERARGQYVDVILLDVTHCTDGSVLAARILERAQQKAGAHADTALGWSDIQHRSIVRATLAEHV